MVKFVLGPDTRWEAERIADVVGYKLRNYEGFQSYRFLANYDTGEYIGIGYWETGLHAMFARQEMTALLREMIGSKYQWEPFTEFFTTYESKYTSADAK